MIGVVAGNIGGNIFIKLGSTVTDGRAVLLGLFGWQTLVGIVLFASSLLLYAWALKFIPLYVAQSIVALQFTGAVMAAYFYFGERIDGLQWVGIVLILAGLFVVAR